MQQNNLTRKRLYERTIVARSTAYFILSGKNVDEPTMRKFLVAFHVTLEDAIKLKLAEEITVEIRQSADPEKTYTRKLIFYTFPDLRSLLVKECISIKTLAKRVKMGYPRINLIYGGAKCRRITAAKILRAFNLDFKVALATGVVVSNEKDTVQRIKGKMNNG
jgi:hypothetical protein